MRGWADPLAVIIAGCFNCNLVTTTFGKGKALGITFIGDEVNLEIAVWYYKRLKMTVIKKSKSEFKLVKDQKAFAYGCVISLKNRLEMMFVAPREAARSVGERGLIVVKDKLVEQEKEKLFPNAKNRKNNKVDLGNQEAYLSGRIAGEEIEINKVVAGTETATLSYT